MQHIEISPKYAVGQFVTIKNEDALGHCRTPQYVRGAHGRVVSYIGTYRNPEDLAYGGSGLPQSPLYWIEISLADLWSYYAEDKNDRLRVEVFEHWLTTFDKGVSNHVT